MPGEASSADKGWENGEVAAKQCSTRRLTLGAANNEGKKGGSEAVARAEVDVRRMETWVLVAACGLECCTADDVQCGKLSNGSPYYAVCYKMNCASRRSLCSESGWRGFGFWFLV